MDSSGEHGSHKDPHPYRKKVVWLPRRVDYPRKDTRSMEEYAAEVAPPRSAYPAFGNRTDKDARAADPINASAEVREDEEVHAFSGVHARSDDRSLGYLALVLGIMSLFLWPIVLGPAAAIIGFVSYGKGQKTAGAWAIGLGIISALSYFIMIPFAG